jgi:hypothetical protein
MPKPIESEWQGVGGRPAGAKRLEDLNSREAMSLLYQGVTLSDMEVLFRMDRRTIMAKLSGKVEPCGTRGKGRSEIWQIRDAAPHLVKPAGDIEEYIKRMRPNDLPPLLTKEYWNGQRAKQKFLEDEGDLWRTDRVVDTLASAFKTVRMNLLLVPDALERRAALSDQQREELRVLIDGTLQGLRDALIEQFGGDDTDQPGVGAGEVATADDEFFVPPEILGEDTREFEPTDDGDL